MENSKKKIAAITLLEEYAALFENQNIATSEIAHSSSVYEEYNNLMNVWGSQKGASNEN